MGATCYKPKNTESFFCCGGRERRSELSLSSLSEEHVTKYLCQDMDLKHTKELEVCGVSVQVSSHSYCQTLRRLKSQQGITVLFYRQEKSLSSCRLLTSQTTFCTFSVDFLKARSRFCQATGLISSRLSGKAIKKSKLKKSK